MMGFTVQASAIEKRACVIDLEKNQGQHVIYYMYV